MCPQLPTLQDVKPQHLAVFLGHAGKRLGGEESFCLFGGKGLVLGEGIGFFHHRIPNFHQGGEVFCLVTPYLNFHCIKTFHKSCYSYYTTLSYFLQDKLTAFDGKALQNVV